MARRLRAGLLGLVAATSLAGKRAEEKAAPMGPSLVPADGMYLRASFDVDPSAYVGRFLPSGTKNLDESSAMQTTCGKYVKSKEIEAGGVVYDEIFSASTSVAAKVGVPLVAGLSAGTEETKAVRVRYTLLKKLVFDITDPAAFEGCCKAAPDQCTDRFVGEFLMGTGEVFYGLGADTGVKGQGAANAVVGSLEVKNGVSWAKSIQFPNPVYFAFKVANNAWSGAQTSGCGAWTDAPPKSTQGTYFVGVSEPATTEANARTQALADARLQAVRWAGTEIGEGRLTVTGSSADVRAKLGDSVVVTTASQGVASWVKDESWCNAETPTPEGILFVTKVLAFLPRQDEAAVAGALVAAAGAK